MKKIWNKRYVIFHPDSYIFLVAYCTKLTINVCRIFVAETQLVLRTTTGKLLLGSHELRPWKFQSSPPDSVTPALASSPPPAIHHRWSPSLPLRYLAGGRRKWKFIVFNKFFLVDRVIRVSVSPCQFFWYWSFISFSSSPATVKGGIVFSMTALLEMRTTTTVSATSPAWQHRDLSFRTATSRWRWCRRHGIIFSGFFSILSWLNLATMKKDQPSSFFCGKKKKKEDTRKKKFLNSAYMNVGRYSLDICSQAFCRVFACAVIHTWFWDLELFTVWV